MSAGSNETRTRRCIYPLTPPPSCVGLNLTKLVCVGNRHVIHIYIQAIVEFHSLAAAKEGDSSNHPRVGQLEMPEDGSTTAVSGKGLSCTVRGLKVSRPPTNRLVSVCACVFILSFFLLCSLLVLHTSTHLSASRWHKGAALRRGRA